LVDFFKVLKDTTFLKSRESHGAYIHAVQLIIQLIIRVSARIGTVANQALHVYQLLDWTSGESE
jgi:hypothetical protein